ARFQPAHHATPNLLGAGSIRVPDSERPAEDLVAQRARDGVHGWIPESMRRAKGARGAPRGVLNRGVGGSELDVDEASAPEVELGVMLGVIPDLVRAPSDPRGEIRKRPRVPAQDKERGRDAPLLEDVQNSGRRRGAGPVIEGQVENLRV